MCFVFSPDTRNTSTEVIRINACARDNENINATLRKEGYHNFDPLTLEDPDDMTSIIPSIGSNRLFVKESNLFMLNENSNGVVLFKIGFLSGPEKS